MVLSNNVITVWFVPQICTNSISDAGLPSLQSKQVLSLIEFSSGRKQTMTLSKFFLRTVIQVVGLVCE